MRKSILTLVVLGSLGASLATATYAAEPNGVSCATRKNMGLVAPKELALADGTKITLDRQGDQVYAFRSTADTPLADGGYTLASGSVLQVKDGVVVNAGSVTEVRDAWPR